MFHSEIEGNMKLQSEGNDYVEVHSDIKECSMFHSEKKVKRQVSI